MLKRSVCVLLWLVAYCGNAHGWGFSGHRLICQIAYDELQPATQKEIDGLLASLSDKHKRNLNRYLKRAATTPIQFADSCVWADAVRRMDYYKPFASWHYVNVSRDGSPVSRQHCADDCILHAIPTHFSALGQPQSSWQRAQALMFLGHWVGDIHQPLHIGFKDDLGGNKVMVSIAGERANLHRVWDVDILRWAAEHKGWNFRQLKENVDAAPIDTSTLNYSADAVIRWAEESRQLAQSKSVAYCQPGNGCQSFGKKTRYFNESYYREHWSTVRARMKLAAGRLAVALEAALAK